MIENLTPHTNKVVDVAALGAIGGSLAGWLPPIAALLGAVWYCILIWESKTAQAIRRRLFGPAPLQVPRDPRDSGKS